MEKNTSFIINGNRQFPLFQISDVPYFKNGKDDKKPPSAVIYNTFCTVFCEIEKNYAVGCLAKDYPAIGFPTLFLLAYGEPELSVVLDKLNITYTKTTTAPEEGFYIQVCKNAFYSIPEDCNSYLIAYLREIKWDRLKKLWNKFNEFETEKEGMDNLIYHWAENEKHLEIAKLSRVKDFAMSPTGFSDEPHSIQDIFYYLINNNVVISERDINDVGRRKIRLSEWLIYKCSQQHKYFIEKNKKDLDKKKNATVFDRGIIETLKIDQRKALDDTVNPLGELCIMSRVIFTGPGGIDEETANIITKNLHQSYKNVIDYMDTPPGNKAGLTQHIVPFVTLDKGIMKPAEIDEGGFIEG